MAIDYAKCILKGYNGITMDDFSLQDSGSGIEIVYWNSAFGDKPTLQSLEQYWLAAVKIVALVEIKELRQQGLDLAARSAGVYAIYEANYEAAIDFLNGQPDIIMKSGMTPEQHLTGFGSKLNMTATQFATYVVNENLRVGPTVYDVEARYLALTYAGDIPNGIYPISVLTTEAQINATVEGYRTYCGL